MDDEEKLASEIVKKVRKESVFGNRKIPTFGCRMCFSAGILGLEQKGMIDQYMIYNWKDLDSMTDEQFQVDVSEQLEHIKASFNKEAA